MYVKEKLHLMQLNRKGRYYSRLLQKRRETQFNSAETKDKRIFKCGGELMEKYWRTLLGRLVNVIRPLVFHNCLL